MSPSPTHDPHTALSLEGRGVDGAAPSVAGTARSALGSLPIIDLASGDQYSCSPLEPGPLRSAPTPPLPMSRREMHERGWDEVDVVFVSGDAYVDHPSFAMALLGAVCSKAKGFAWASSASPTGEIVTPGARSAGRGYSLPSAPATWTR